MPVSSTLSTSAPRSANSSVQKPPGRSRVRSRTLSPLSGNTRSNSEQPAGFLDRRGTATCVLDHLPCLRDEIAVRARHLTIRQIEVVLEPDADRSAERQ